MKNVNEKAAMKAAENEMLKNFELNELEERLEMRSAHWLEKHDPKHPGFIIILPL